jgi:cell division protein FtsN
VQVQPAAEPFTYEAPAHGDVFAEPIQMAAVEIPSVAQQTEVVSAPRVTAAVTSLVETPPPAKRAAPPVFKAPLLAFAAAKKLAPPRAKPVGRYVVQIGAYRTAEQVEAAWARAYRRYNFAGGQPLSTTITLPRKGTLHRLAVSGYDRHQDAAQLCQSIRAKGATCFVRATAGDAPVQWASRYQAGRA